MDLREFAMKYEPEQAKTIADLEVVRADVEIKEDMRDDPKEDGKKYKFMFIVVDGIEYRVPSSVIMQLKGILAVNPHMTSFKVNKTGTGLATKYQVIPLG